jgi:hypothetical protein
MANQHKGRGLASKRRMVGLTQHDLSREARVLLSRLIFAETGRIGLEPDELDRVKKVLRNKARKALDAIEA